MYCFQCYVIEKRLGDAEWKHKAVQKLIQTSSISMKIDIANSFIVFLDVFLSTINGIHIELATTKEISLILFTFFLVLGKDVKFYMNLSIKIWFEKQKKRKRRGNALNWMAPWCTGKKNKKSSIRMAFTVGIGALNAHWINLHLRLTE